MVRKLPRREEVRSPTTTLSEGKIGEQSDVRMDSTADRAMHRTDIGGNAKVDIRHRPQRTGDPSINPGRAD